MKQIKRDKWAAYFKAPVTDNGTVWGITPLHKFNCGTFTENEIEYDLFYVIMMRDYTAASEDELVESFDASAFTVDWATESELFQAAIAGTYEQPDIDSDFFFPQSVADLIHADSEAGLTDTEIAQKHMSMLLDAFLGFTFDEVLALYPTIYSESTTTDDEGSEHTLSSIWRCDREGFI
jgi:hypothetical protein